MRTLAYQAGLASFLEVDSAGTHAYHEGEAPDPRVRKAAARRSYDLGRLRARRLVEADFVRFDRILAMDRQNLAFMTRICPPDLHSKLGLFLDFATGVPEDEIPDPYYGGAEGFERVLDLCELAGKGLIASVAALAPNRRGKNSE